MKKETKSKTAKPSRGYEIKHFDAAEAAAGMKKVTCSAIPEGLIRRSMPRLRLPKEMQIGEVITGKILAVVDSPGKDVDGKCLKLEHENGEIFLFPMGGVIAHALGDDHESLAGKTFAAQRLDNVFNTKYKKDMFNFDVFTS